jgi:hypothetical protein
VTSSLGPSAKVRNTTRHQLVATNAAIGTGASPVRGLGCMRVTTAMPLVPQPAATPAPQTSPAISQASGPVLSLANPNPGDLLPIGNIYVSGVAYDPAAPQGTDGVDSLEFFLDSRDSGGTNLDSGIPNGDQSFNIKIAIPSNMSGGHTFYAYAQSSITGITGTETVASVPVFVGIAPTPTPRPTS